MQWKSEVFKTKVVVVVNYIHQALKRKTIRASALTLDGLAMSVESETFQSHSRPGIAQPID